MAKNYYCYRHYQLYNPLIHTDLERKLFSCYDSNKLHTIRKVITNVTDCCIRYNLNTSHC